MFCYQIFKRKRPPPKQGAHARHGAGKVAPWAHEMVLITSTTVRKAAQKAQKPRTAAMRSASIYAPSTEGHVFFPQIPSG